MNAPPDTMMAVVTTGQGGYEKLVYTSVPTPRPGPGDVLLRVLAAGMNNTEINTRLGWYSDSVTDGTDSTESGAIGDTRREDGGWNAATPFPFIQGADCCGRVVTVGAGADDVLIGKRVLVRSCQHEVGSGAADNRWMGVDFDGAFAQFVVVKASEVFPVDCAWTDAELATIPCAYGTAENMLHRTDVADGQRVLITGASGGVGSAAVQLAKRRGAEVLAVSGASKHAALARIGADRLLDRDADLVEALGTDSVDVVLDMVAGPAFGALLEVLARGGRYACSGAIAGPIVRFDTRKMYLKDLQLFGCVGWDAPVFPNLIGYIERGEIRPVLDRSWPLDQIADAQRAFQQKNHVGKMVLLPPV